MIVNTPHNPTGVVYSEETIKKLAAILEKKQQEFGSVIYLISDEPYRELAYDDVSSVSDKNITTILLLAILTVNLCPFRESVSVIW